MAQYVALLRGINLGNRRIKMDALRADFEAWGLRDVRTALASGNVAFESAEGDPDKIRETIEGGFAAKYGWEVPTCVRGTAEIGQLVASDPFAEIEESKEIQPYVTFLTEPPSRQLDLPYVYEDGDYRILDVQAGHVVSVLDRRGGHGTLDVMAVLEDLFGADITTRNWNTVLKIHALIDGDAG